MKRAQNIVIRSITGLTTVFYKFQLNFGQHIKFGCITQRSPIYSHMNVAHLLCIKLKTKVFWFSVHKQYCWRWHVLQRHSTSSAAPQR